MNPTRRGLLAAPALALPAALKAQPSPERAPPAPGRETWHACPELSAPFKAMGTQGVFVAYDAPTRRWITNDAERAFVRYTPASTFKIPGTLLALETGAADGLDAAFRWDGQRHPIAAHNRDQTLETAFQVSAVWVYQAIARRIGPDGMRRSMQMLRYGSADVGPATAHDRFWLEGPLTISAVEQVDFLRRLDGGLLPIRPATEALARRIMRRDDDPAPGQRLYAKTGWGHTRAGVTPGWFVGWHEREDGSHCHFALNLDIRCEAHGPARIAIARQLLRGLSDG